MVIQSPDVRTLSTTWNILIIEDDEDEFLIARDILKEAKGRCFEVHWARTYAAGREALFTNHYNAVLVDYDLGLHSGIELIREANERGYPAPLILFTGRGSYEVDVEALEAGATMYLTKSEANPLLLERSIRYAIELKQSQMQLRESNERLAEQLAERKQAEAALRASDERFYKAFHASPNAQAISRQEDGYILEINEAFEKIFGYSRAEVIGKTSLELDMYINPADRQKYVQKLHENQAVHDYELEMRTRTGQIIQTSLSVVMIQVGERSYMLTIFQDITERKQAEATLIESEARFHALISASAQVLYRMSPDWTEMRQLQGGNFLADTETPNTNCLDEYIHPDDQPWVLQVIGNAVRKGIVFELEHRVLRADGTLGWTASRAVPVRNATGEIVEWFGVASDITERKQVEAALRQEREFLRTVIDATPSMVFVKDWEGRFVLVNQALARCYGTTIEGIIGKTDADFNPNANEVVHFLHDDQEVIRTQTEKVIPAEPVTHADGQVHLYSTIKVPLMNSDGTCNRLLGVATDITERGQMEEELAQANAALKNYAETLKHSNQELEQFAFIAAHDLQEPLRKINMFSRHFFIQENIEHIEEVKEYIDRIRKASERMQKMIDGLLALARVNTRGGVFTPVSLSAVIQGVLSDLEPRLTSTGGEVITTNLPTIEADELQMVQLFQNLIGNAIKFHKPGVPPAVRVTGEIQRTNGSPAAEIRIEDNGIGFAQKDAERIFQPFQRLHGKSEYEGTGLGLAICQKIVERHNGKIEVNSVPGEGTTFIIRFPRQTTR